LYIYGLIILLSVLILSFRAGAKKIVLVCLICWVALDFRILLDHARTVGLDLQTYFGKNLEEKRAATTLGDFYGFIQFAKAKLPEGTAFNFVHAPGYYYLEKANYYLYPTYYDKNGRYILVYDPSRTMPVPTGAKLVATYKEGEYILQK
jgi:hypothetical protein